MRVGVFLGDYTPADGGGFTFQAETLNAVARLATESAHTFVLVADDVRALQPLIANTPLQVLQNPGSNPIEKIKTRLARSFSGLRGRGWLHTTLDQALLADKIDVVWFIHPRAVEVNLPYITIVWDLQHRLQPWFPEVGMKGEWLSREKAFARFLPRASYIIAGTEAGKNEIELFYGVPDWRIKLLPHPTPDFARNAEAQPRDVLEKFNLPDPFLFYPAQFWAHKNHANLLHAVAHLRDEEQIVFHLAFSGSDHGNRAYIEGLAKELGLLEQVHFLGFVSIEEMIALYQHAFALTYVSLFGPENLPPLEAMALGCPVVAGRVSGAEEQFGEAALLVTPTDPLSIAAGIKQLMDDATKQALIEKGKARAADFTIDDFVRGVFDILDEFEPFRRTWGN